MFRDVIKWTFLVFLGNKALFLNLVCILLDLLYVTSIMQRQLIGHNSLHNIVVVYV
jgi:hypothetical protein